MATRERPAGPAAPTELIGSPAPPPAEPPPDRELWPWLLVLLALVIAGLAAVWYATLDSGGASGPVTVQTTVGAKPKPEPKPVEKHATSAATTTQPQTVVVPDLVGQSRDDAVSTLEAQGLRPDVQEVPSSTADGTVVSQHPAGGTKVDAQSGVLINIGRKVESKPATTAESEPAKTISNTTQQPPAPATVPSLVGEDEGSASADLIDVGFSPTTVDQATTDPTQDGMVLDQSPKAGSSARPGSTVTIYVARYSGSDEFSTG